MKGLFEKTGAKTSANLSKSDKKKYNAVLGNALDMKTDYKVVQLTSRLKLIRDAEKFLYFECYDKLYPTIQNFDKKLFPVVVLDEGAMGPIGRGADVMAPGVLKYQHLASHFKKGDVIGVEILDQGIFAVGQCVESFDEMVKKQEGPVIEIYHVKGDPVDLNVI